MSDNVGTCPECGASIQMQRPKINDTVVCRDCGEKLEVVNLNPLELDFFYDMDDDDEWDDDYDFEEEDDYDDDDDDDFDYGDYDEDDE